VCETHSNSSAALRIRSQNVVAVGRSPAQHDGGVSTGFRLIGIAPQGSPNRLRRIAVVVDYKIGMTAFATEPAIDLGAILFQRTSDGSCGRLQIGPSGGGGDVSFMAKALRQLIVGAANVFAKCVPAGGLVLRQVAREARSIGCFLSWNREVGLDPRF